MPSNFIKTVCHILSAAVAVIGGFAAAADSPLAISDVAPALATEDRQVYVVEIERSSQGRLFFAPTAPPEGTQADLSLAARGAVLSRTSSGERRLSFSVETADGAPVYSIDLSLSVEPGSVPFDVDWPIGGAGEGDYTARLSVFDPTLGEEARGAWRVYLRSEAAVASRVELARDEVARAREAFGDAIPPDARQRLALALQALAPFPSDDRPLIEADSNAHFASETARHVRARLAFGIGKGKNIVETPGDAQAPTTAQVLAAAPGQMLGGVVLGDGPAAPERLTGLGFSFMPLLKPAPGDSLSAPAEFPAMLWMPAAGDVAQARTPEELKSSAEIGIVAAVSLWTGPKAAPAGPESREEFRQYLSKVYKDRIELGRAWKRNLAGFEEVDLWPAVTNRAYQYDVQSFQRRRMTRWVSEQLHSAEASVAPAAATVTFTEALFMPGEARTEPIAESLAAMLPVLSVHTAGPLDDTRYAARFPGAQLMYALFHSFAPERPLVALRSVDYSANDRLRMDSEAQLRTIALEAALEGVTSLAVEFPGLEDPVSGAPEALAGFTGALRDLRGAEEAIAAFRAADAPVVILWSDSSRLLDNGAAHLTALANAYEGCSFGGQKVGFITEGQLAEGQWRAAKVVVLPNVAALAAEARDGLESLIASGAGVIRSESGPVYDEHGRALGRGFSAGANSVLVRGRGEPREYLDALDDFISRGVLPDSPRAITASGYPIEGVKTRYVETSSARYLYVVNLRKEPVTCRLSRDIGDATNVLTGRPLAFPRRLDPLDPILLRISSETPAN